MKKIYILLILSLAIVLSGCSAPATNNPVVCTMEAKLCPDGSSVGRVPPTCEFAPCPVENELSAQSSAVDIKQFDKSVIDGFTLSQKEIEMAVIENDIGYRLVGDVTEVDRDLFYVNSPFKIEFNSPYPKYLIRSVYLFTSDATGQIKRITLVDNSKSEDWGNWITRDDVVLDEDIQNFVIVFINNDVYHYKKIFQMTRVAPDNRWNKFSDPEIGIEFDYPKYWGKLTRTFFPMTNGVYILELEDCRYENAELCSLSGGGRNKEYNKETETPIEFYPGFGVYSQNDCCEIFEGDICQQVNKSVYSIITIPSFENMFSSYMFSKPWFTDMVLVDLPQNKNINGFSLKFKFLPRYYDQEFSFLIQHSQCEDKYCSNLSGSSEQLEFNKKAELLLQQIKSGSEDNLIKQRLNDFNLFANSIKIR